jgi:predicted Zn-dependent protease
MRPPALRVGVVAQPGNNGGSLQFVANPRSIPGQRRAQGSAATSETAAPRTRRNPQPTPARESERERRARKKAEDNELPADVRDELRKAIGPDRSAGLERRLGIATKAYERDRYREALAELRVLARLAPGVPAVRELYGLTLYRLGRWREAVRELRAFHDLTGSFDQHPVIADCERALGHDKAVLAAWDQLRQAGVDREVLVEGRLVVAGMLADRGDLPGAIALLGPGGKSLRHPDTCHLRQWYALGDFYERAGELPRARELFERVASFSPELFDVEERLAALR